jgi:hypothetical protein
MNLSGRQRAAGHTYFFVRSVIRLDKRKQQVDRSSSNPACREGKQ